MEEHIKTVLEWIKKEFEWTEDEIRAEWTRTFINSFFSCYGTVEGYTAKGLEREVRPTDEIAKIIQENKMS